MREEVQRLPYWDKLTGSEQEFTERHAAVRTFLKGEFLKGPDESCFGMVHILSGSVRALMLSEEGREITLFRLHAGDSCVLSASCVLSQLTFETELQATEPTRVLVVNAGAFARLMEQNVEVRCFSYALATERSSAVIWVLQEILFAKFDRRLARYLLSACEKAGGDGITATKEAIARDVNTAREVVSRMLKQFEDDGLIRTDRKTIVLTDKEALRALL